MKRRGVAANSTLALAGDAASKASGIVAVAIAARWLSVPQFALLGASLAAATILTAVLDGGLGVLVVRDGASDASVRLATLRAGLLSRGPLLALLFCGAAAFGVVQGSLGPALLVVAASALGALALAVLAVFRAAQDLSVEASQKLASGLLLPAFVAVAVALRPSAVSVLAGFVCSQALSLPLAFRPRVLMAPRTRRALLETVRSSAPFGLMAIATLVYYRSGTLLLAGLRPADDTAEFTIASNVALGLLALPNAITTGLLPSLSAACSEEERLRTARRGLTWTIALSVALALVVGLLAPVLLPTVFGHRYEGATTPLAVLLVADVLIAVSGVLGTLLVASRQVKPLVVQVAASLVVNLAVGAVLVPVLGAVGAAVATLITELIAVIVLGVALRDRLAILFAGYSSRAVFGHDRRVGAVKG